MSIKVYSYKDAEELQAKIGGYIENVFADARANINNRVYMYSIVHIVLH